MKNAKPDPGEKAGEVVVATLMRPVGVSGLQTSAVVLRAALDRQGFDTALITPFSANAMWMPILGVRRLGLGRLNSNWSIRWHRYWHRHALRQALFAYCRDHSVDVILAQCPVSARAALQCRELLSQELSVVLVCHFNRSQADEFAGKGELTNSRLDRAIRAEEARVIEEVDSVVYVSDWLRNVVEEERGIRPRDSQVIWNGVVLAKVSPLG